MTTTILNHQRAISRRVRTRALRKGVKVAVGVQAVFTLAAFLKKHSNGIRTYKISTFQHTHWYREHISPGIIYNYETHLYLAYKIDSHNRLRIIDNLKQREAILWCRDENKNIW